MGTIRRDPKDYVIVGENGKSYQIVWTIDGPANADAVLTYPGVPRFNDQHPERPEALASNIAVVGQQNSQYWTVTVTYSIPDRTLHRDIDKRLGEPPTIRWTHGTAQEAIDLDIYENPIVNSAGEGFRNPFIHDVPLYFLTVKRWEVNFDPSIMFRYGKRVNSDVFYGVQPGQCYCHHIMPTQDYDRTSPVVQVEYHFEFREDGFEARMKDQGFNELVPALGNSPASLKPILLRDGTPVNIDSPLNGFGRPFDRTRVFDYGNGNNGTPPGAAIQIYERAVYLKYVVKRSARFADLNLE